MGACGMHLKPRSVVAKAIRQGYYWPTMHRDAREEIRKCNSCQIHSPIPKLPKTLMTSIMAPWPFFHGKMDVLRTIADSSADKVRNCSHRLLYEMDRSQTTSQDNRERGERDERIAYAREGERGDAKHGAVGVCSGRAKPTAGRWRSDIQRVDRVSRDYLDGTGSTATSTLGGGVYKWSSVWEVKVGLCRIHVGEKEEVVGYGADLG
ncbi:reverse transcriptase domain-containing protein [Tanacetum coccineum]